MKSEISRLFAKFACSNLAVKFSAVILLNSGVVIYLLWSGILFSAALKAAVVAKLAISCILSSISLILALYTSFLTTLFFY